MNHFHHHYHHLHYQRLRVWIIILTKSPKRTILCLSILHRWQKDLRRILIHPKMKISRKSQGLLIFQSTRSQKKSTLVEFSLKSTSTIGVNISPMKWIIDLVRYCSRMPLVYIQNPRILEVSSKRLGDP